MSLNLTSLGFGAGMAAIDAGAFPIVKYVSLGLDPIWMIIPTILYACEPYILLQSLKHDTLVIMNSLWDTMSDVLVAGIGILYFKEKLTTTKLLGVALSIVSIFLMTYE